MQTTIDTPAANPRLTREEAAYYIGISAETLATWATRGGGPVYIKVGSRCIYLQRDLEAWMQARRVSSTAEVE